MWSWWDVSRRLPREPPSCHRNCGGFATAERNLAKDRLEGEGPCSTALDAGAAFALPTLQNQLLVGLFQEGLEEFDAGLRALPGERLSRSGRGDARLGWAWAEPS